LHGSGPGADIIGTSKPDLCLISIRKFYAQGGNDLPHDLILNVEYVVPLPIEAVGLMMSSVDRVD
jgi:hypothetical protein